MKKLLFALVFVPIICFGEIKYLDESDVKKEQNDKYEDFLKNSSIELEKFINSSNDELKNNILNRDDMNLILNELSLKLSFVNERLKSRDEDFKPIEFFDTIKDLKINPYSDSNTIELIYLSNISFIYAHEVGGDIFSDIKVIHSKILSHCRSLSLYRDILMYRSNKLAKK